MEHLCDRGIAADAYRQSADEAGILPREMQSITWEGIRGLFPATYKAQEDNVNAVRGIWDNYRKGNIPLDEARAQVNLHAGGYNDPAWYDPRYNIADYVGKSDSSYQDQLYPDGVPGQPTRGKRGVGAGVAGSAGGVASTGALAGAPEPLTAADLPPLPSVTQSLLMGLEGGDYGTITPAPNPWLEPLADTMDEIEERTAPGVRPFLPFIGAMGDWARKGIYGENDWYDAPLVGADLL